jgi:hypothetical protein
MPIILILCQINLAHIGIPPPPTFSTDPLCISLLTLTRYNNFVI